MKIEERFCSLFLLGSVQYMISKLDADCTGVIVLSDFLDEFFPYQVLHPNCFLTIIYFFHQIEIDPPKVFPLYHYNGLRQSSGTKVSNLSHLRECYGSCLAIIHSL